MGKHSPEFDQYASAYDELLDDPLRNRFSRDPLHFHRRKWYLIRRLLRSRGITTGTRKWLDVGCGRGELLNLAGREFASACGCDPSARMLSPQTAYKTYEQASPVELPFRDRSLDFVTAICVFHHVHGEDRTLLIREIRRVLTPGGWCCIIEHNPRNPVTRTIVRRCPVDADAELLTSNRTRDLLRASGFSSLANEYFLFLPEILFQWVGAAERAFSKLALGGQYAILAQAPLHISHPVSEEETSILSTQHSAVDLPVNLPANNSLQGGQAMT
jgi:ubiquinone/menaquinone biosynthesis C-methylase UbiE